ncbi:hypothetical protein IAE57_03355 [Stenotrophomonas sp. S48]|uniref:hypothetical protein n=1 Tax=unclassified Stenotrophomonas TaxID=196198 RepID=UPI0019029FDE|nr:MULTISPECIES: hypothetical protein [unclassified Stenotrophomonas]MBK0025188.1 hypothetical protein [Stenotrophomonas sp. S48]MBK0046771.1 hypothetical protein [Stenotrophomonas sp. S49]
MKNPLLHLLLAGAMTACGFSAQATEAFHCDDCNLGKRQTLSRERGEGDYYFWDFRNRRLYHMNVKGEGGGPLSAAGLPVVKEVMLTAEEHAMFNAGLQLYDVNGGSPVVTHTLPVIDIPVQLGRAGNSTLAEPAAYPANDGPTVPMNAMDAVTTPQLRQEAIQKTFSYSNLGPFWYTLESTRASISAFSQAIQSTLLPTPISIINRVPFPDGSYILVNYNWNVRDYSYIPGSARDAVGNIIPDSQKDVANQDQATQNYEFPNSPAGYGSGEEMVRHLDRLGVGWDGPNSPPIHRGYRIGCTYTPTGVRCQIISLNP